MENYYQVKYAVMPVYERELTNIHVIGLGHDHIVAYVASKCYIISHDEKYNVFFPFQRQYDKMGRGKFVREYPDFEYSHVIMHVDNVFDTKEEAIEEAEKMNEQMINFYQESDKAVIKYFNEEYLRLKRKVKKYKELEKYIENSTSNMRVGEVYKLDDMPKDVYTGIFEHLSLYERESLKRDINDMSCSNCTNTYCKNEDIDKCNNWVNEKKMVLSKYKNN